MKELYASSHKNAVTISKTDAGAVAEQIRWRPCELYEETGGESSHEIED